MALLCFSLTVTIGSVMVLRSKVDPLLRLVLPWR